MSKEPPIKRILQHYLERRSSYGIFLWNVINIREIVLDYSELSHENYRFLLEFATDAYLHRRLVNLSKNDMMKINQKYTESLTRH